MVNPLLLDSYYLMWTLLVVSSCLYLLSGLDDLFFDIYYWIYYWGRFVRKKGDKPIVYSELALLEEKRIAVMVPCWHEAGVIEDMLRSNVFAIDYKNYDLFIGVYANDPNTVAAVQKIAETVPHIQIVIGPNPGPTTKADNLNTIYQGILQFEQEHNVRFEIFLLQDAEDIIHPLSFKLYNSLIPPNHMVQTPVLPLEVNLNQLLQWTYSAEFSEMHTKDIIVREAIKSMVPSAGVGTGFSRHSLELLATANHGHPFEITTVTEDYSTAYKIRLYQLKQKFVIKFFWQTIWRKKWYFFGKPVARRTKEYIATRSLFPHEYMKSIRQRARWILGISLQEWQKHGWQGNLSTRYILLHDRKSLVTYINAGLFFILIPFWIIYSLLTWHNPFYPTLQDRFDANPWVWQIILIDTVLMLQRVAERGIALWRIYGPLPALLSPILVFYGNIINIHALLRAYWLFLKTPQKKAVVQTLQWDKTDHEFPKARTVPRIYKIGEAAIQQGMITHTELVNLLDLQARSGKPLGQLLIDNHYINQKQLLKLLALQYALPLIDAKKIKLLFAKNLPLVPKWHYRKLIGYHCYPIGMDEQTVTVGIQDPSNELVLTAASELLKPYKVKFALLET